MDYLSYAQLLKTFFRRPAGISVDNRPAATPILIIDVHVLRVLFTEITYAMSTLVIAKSFRMSRTARRTVPRRSIATSTAATATFS